MAKDEASNAFNADDFEQFTPLMVAVYQNRLSSIMTLLRDGHSPLQRNKMGQTALSIAKAMKNDYVIEVLNQAIGQESKLYAPTPLATVAKFFNAELATSDEDASHLLDRGLKGWTP